MDELVHDTAEITSAERVTFKYERLRAAAGGILETAAGTFLVYIALTKYKADANPKALIMAGGNWGMLLSPLIVFWAALQRWRPAAVGAVLSLLGALGFIAAALVPSLEILVGGGVWAMVCAAIFVPLMTQLYQDNFPEERRGRLFSATVVIRIAAAIGFGLIGGWLLAYNFDWNVWLLWIFAACMIFSALCLWRCPSTPLNHEGHTNPFKGLAHVRDDALFRNTLISWMLMGFANLVMVQLRVEYLANAKYGKPFDASQVALLTITIPNLARLLLSPVWGRLFDRMNFFGLRIILNIGFAIGALAFFMGRGMPEMVLGAVVFGISNAGGDLAWSLWVTKLAPPDRVAEYMSVHTFLTGFRGVLAPFVAFHLAEVWSFQRISGVAAGMIIAASLLLVPEIRTARINKSVSAPLMEKVAE